MGLESVGNLLDYFMVQKQEPLEFCSVANGKKSEKLFEIKLHQNISLLP